jgi:hypothetical protein
MHLPSHSILHCCPFQSLGLACDTHTKTLTIPVSQQHAPDSVSCPPLLSPQLKSESTFALFSFFSATWTTSPTSQILSSPLLFCALFFIDSTNFSIWSPARLRKASRIGETNNVDSLFCDPPADDVVTQAFGNTHRKLIGLLYVDTEEIIHSFVTVPNQLFHFIIILVHQFPSCFRNFHQDCR